MNKLKTKINTEGRKIEITVYNGKEKLEKIIRYQNHCIVCGKSTFDNVDLGKEHICPNCIKFLTTKLKSKEVKTEQPVVKKERKKIVGRTFIVAREYNPQIKIVDFMNYYNLMTHHFVNEKLATAIVDLIIKGVNTPSKIKKALSQYKLNSIYLYLSTMARAGMLSTAEPSKTTKGKTSRYNKIFKIHKNLTYTTIE